MTTTKGTKSEQITLDHPINKHVTTEWILLTPELAKEYLGDNIGNRNIRRLVVQQYVQDLQSADWLTTHAAIAFDWNGRLIDGQHRCEAVIVSGEPIYTLVVRGLDPHVQDVIDTNARRTAPDALRFNGIEHNQSTVSGAARIAKARASGLLQSASTAHAPVTMTNQEVLHFVRENPEINNAAALAKRTSKTIGAAPAALAYCIWELEKIDATAAVEFFVSTADFATNGKNDPRATLLRTFNRMREDKTHMTAGVQILYIFRAWNAWRNGEPLGSIRSQVSRDGVTKSTTIPKPI